MTPLKSVGLLFWITVIACAAAFGSDRELKEVLYRLRFLLLLLVSLVVIWRIPLHGRSFFHGLEYEDSYVYSVAGRQFGISNASALTDQDFPYSITTCAAGSLEHCLSWQTFPEHLIGYPYLISVCSKLVGYSSSIGSIINLVGSMISSVLIFIITILLTGDTVAATASLLVFACTPVFAVYGLETSAEPISNLFLLLGLYFFVRLSDRSRVSPGVLVCIWCAFTCSLLYGMTIKREDVLAVVLLLAFAIGKLCKESDRDRTRIQRSVLLCLTAALSVCVARHLHLMGTAQGERALIHQFPFTAQEMFRFLLEFIGSFTAINWYGGTVLLVMAGFIGAFVQWRNALVVVVSLLAFAVLYGLHIRSYYEMRSASTTLEGALRFSMNMMGLWSITSGLGLGFLYQRIPHRIKRPSQFKWALLGISALVAVLSFRATYRLGAYETEDEQISRLEPASSTSAIAASADRPVWILTMEPLVFQMYGNAGLNLVDLESVSAESLSQLAMSHPDSQWLLERETARMTDAETDRYSGALECVLAEQVQSKDARDDFEVDRIKPPQTCR